jgi:hypothetical protein
VTSVRIDDLVDQVQPEPEAVPPVELGRALEGLEDALLIGLRDTDALIGHGEPRRISIAPD